MNTQDNFDIDHIAMKALTKAPMSVVLTNPRLEDNPIVYVNKAFEEVTGFSRDAAIGRNCRFLQGDDTDQEAVIKLRQAIENGEEIAVDLRNYRADGTEFVNRLMIAPLEDNTGEIAFFMGVQMALDKTLEASVEEREDQQTDTILQELQHRVKNHLSMIVGMIRLQARQSDAAADFGTLSRRIEALQLLYEELGETSASQVNSAEIALGAYVSRIGNAIAHLDGRSGVRVNIDADAVYIPFETATRIGLVVSEILTNSLQHAFVDREAGMVELRLKELSEGVLRITVVDDGIGLPEDSNWPQEGNLGSRIVRDLLSDLDATLSVQTENLGTTVAFDIPYRKTD